MTDPNHKAIARAEHGIAPERMHPLVAVAMASGTLEPGTLRELLAVQREYEAGEARKAFTRALVALKRDMPTVLARDATVDFTSAKGRTHYKHTSLAHALDQITEPLTAHGFSLAWTPARSERGEVIVTCRLTHAEGHHTECTLSAPVDTSGNKSPAQGVASTVTLLSRYTALSLLGIATADMADPAPAERVEADGPHIDAARNLRAVGRLARLGRTREDAERYIGRPVQAWTAADLARLAAWVQHNPEHGEVPPDQEPPQ
jgi:hypothetical protein